MYECLTDVLLEISGFWRYYTVSLNKYFPTFLQIVIPFKVQAVLDSLT